MHKFVRVLDLKYGLLCQELEAKKLNETNSYPNIQQIPKKQEIDFSTCSV